MGLEGEAFQLEDFFFFFFICAGIWQLCNVFNATNMTDRAKIRPYYALMENS